MRTQLNALLFIDFQSMILAQWAIVRHTTSMEVFILKNVHRWQTIVKKDTQHLVIFIAIATL